MFSCIQLVSCVPGYCDAQVQRQTISAMSQLLPRSRKARRGRRLDIRRIFLRKAPPARSDEAGSGESRPPIGNGRDIAAFRAAFFRLCGGTMTDAAEFRFACGPSTARLSMNERASSPSKGADGAPRRSPMRGVLISCASQEGGLPEADQNNEGAPHNGRSLGAQSPACSRDAHSPVSSQ